MDEYSAYVGLDVHKDTIAVAVAGREEPVYRGEVRHQRQLLRRLIGKLSPDGEVLSFLLRGWPVWLRGVSGDRRERASL